MCINLLKNYGNSVCIQTADYTLEAFISKINQRIRVVNYEGNCPDQLIAKLDGIASENDWITKIFAIVKEKDADSFLKLGYEKEGVIKEYFKGTDAVIVSKFLNPSRKFTNPDVLDEEQKIMEGIKNIKSENFHIPQLPSGYKIIVPESRIHFEHLADLYKDNFESYPFPVSNPKYLKATAASHVMYALIYDSSGYPVAAASAETDKEHRNAEMTDFATRPTERGKGLASILLHKLEEDVSKIGINALYTIARCRSFGMNKVFKKAGYKHTGKLINNCHICGNLENMSIWCKTIDR
jgi:putative beta-lysine N-acetyltransferase